MDFTLTDEQEMLVDTAASLFAKEFPDQLVRDAVYDPTEMGPTAAQLAFDQHLRDWFALGDESLVNRCLLMEQSGRAVVTGPLWSTTSFALPLLRSVQHGDADAMAAGELSGTVAISGSDGAFQPNSGAVKYLVTDAATVDRVVVVEAGAGAVPTVSVYPAAELDMREVQNLDLSRPVYEVTVPEDSASNSSPIDAEQLEKVIQSAAVALAAEALGTAQWLRDTTIDYVSERQQFGVPVGSFQGLQWKLVDAALVHERASAAVYYAAMCVDADHPDRSDAAHIAKATAGTAARRWATDGLQAHGGIGYTWEHGLHLRLRRAQGQDRLLGDSNSHLDQLASHMFDIGETHE